MQIQLTPEPIEQKSLGKPKSAKKSEPALFQTIKPTVKKKRWNSSIDVEYDPVHDQFLDTNTKNPIYALLDSDEGASYFDDTTIEALEFKSDNRDWITRGGGTYLKLEEILNLKNDSQT